MMIVLLRHTIIIVSLNVTTSFLRTNEIHDILDKIFLKSFFIENFPVCHTDIFRLVFRSKIIFQSTLYKSSFRKINLSFNADSFTSSLNFKACYDFLVIKLVSEEGSRL